MPQRRINISINKNQALFELARRRGQNDLLSFCKVVYPALSGLGEYQSGSHLNNLCKRLTQAVVDMQAGKDTFLIVTMPIRHGKTMTASIAFAAYVLAKCKHISLIQSAYGQQLVDDISKKVKRVIESEQYKWLFPNVSIAKGSDSLSNWAIDGSTGSVTYASLGSSLTGRSAHVIILDDPIKSIEAARSKATRDKLWDSLRADLLTRRTGGMGNLVICVGTPWHIDDPIGRLKKHLSEEGFPQFEVVSYPAINSDGSYLWESYLTKKWYTEQFATLNRQAPALLMCNPLPDEGARFDISKLVIHDTLDGWPTLREVRGWDIASSDTQRSGSNPDWTVGVKLGVTSELTIAGKRHNIWISSVVMCREEAPKRDALMRDTAKADGASVHQYVEAFGGYKDAYTNMVNALKGIAIVKPSRMAGDKSAKLAPLEAPWDAGHVHIYRPGCTQKAFQLFCDQTGSFPSGDHDDCPDAMAVAFNSAIGSSSGFLI